MAIRSGRRPRMGVAACAIFMAALAPAAPASASVIFTNTFYQARVSGPGDFGVFGTWAAATDASHPAGGGRDILNVETAGVIEPFFNFSSLRVYNGAGGVADYSYGGFGGSVNLDDYFTGEAASPFGANGARSTWSVTPEGLNITQDVVVTGTSFAGSAIYHTVEIGNSGETTREIGWRNLYDWKVDDPATDDGPSNAIETESAVVVGSATNEFSHEPAAGEFVRISVDPGVATYEPLLALGLDPGFIATLPTTLPNEYAYVSLPVAVQTVFDYVVDSTRDVTEDSAGLSWFGRDEARAISLAPGESVRLTQVLFGVLPETPPPANEVPEPETLVLLATALIGLGLLRRRRRSH